MLLKSPKNIPCLDTQVYNCGQKTKVQPKAPPFFFFLVTLLSSAWIFIPQRGIEPVSSAVKAPRPKHWATREFPKAHSSLLKQILWPFVIFQRAEEIQEFIYILKEK